MKSIKKHNNKLIFVLSLFAPFLVAAQTPIENIINTIGGLLNSFVIPILMVIATVVFIWGIISYILAVGSDERKKEAKNLIIWGLIGLFVIIAMWGLVQIIGKTFAVPQQTYPIKPGAF